MNSLYKEHTQEENERETNYIKDKIEEHILKNVQDI